MSDISDLHGVLPTSARWNAEGGVLGYSNFDPTTGERTVEVIQLGSPKAKFVMDIATRERGYGLIRQGLYDMRLTPVGSPPPEFTEEMEKDGYKPAIGCWVWNPHLGELRFETNQATLRSAITAFWDHVRTFKEASDGLLPVAHFVGRVEHVYKALSRTFFGPIIELPGFVSRDKITSFVLRPPTVKPPPAIDSQIRHTLLEHPQQKAPERPRMGEAEAPVRTRGSAKTAPAASLEELLDDKLPDDSIPEL